MSTSTDWAILLYPEPTQSTKDTFNPPSMLPLPPDENNDVIEIVTNSKNNNRENQEKEERGVIKNFDEKHNMCGENPCGEAEEDEPEVTLQMEKAKPVTMVLVIGIIVGAFVAMILIVIIVLKIRVRVDGPKCDEAAAAPRYQFAPPNDYGEVGGEQETATTSLMEGSVAPPLAPTAPGNAPAALSAAGGLYNNGMFNNNCAAPRPLQQPLQQPPPPSANGDRSRLFRKSNGSKPVREWYV